jgi:hypothetical protein
MHRVAARCYRIAWLLIAVLCGSSSRADSQIKLPLPDPGSEHPAQFLRLMTRLCDEMKKAVASGATTPLVAKPGLFKQGPIPLVEHSEVRLSQDERGRWVLAGPVAVDARLREEELQAESTSCTAGDNSYHVNVRALHEYFTWATCELHTPSNAQCQLRVEQVRLMPWRARTLEQTLPSRSFTLTLSPSRKPQRPAPVAANKEPERP